MYWPRSRGLAASAGVRLRATETESGNVDNAYIRLVIVYCGKTVS